ncbi:hypothetical protein [Olleya sp. R77988]|uniref:hypothetical protein n=1 Tax=Olleya sp. R77988 TaxID=3093875 RepID=UPI0037CAF390
MKKIILINAIVWAVIILVGSYLFKENPNWKYFFAIVLVAFSIINGFLSNKIKKDKKNCSILK